ncbi:hypothetical protein [Rubrivirga sp. IMCC45206]|uniref:hypothetical protein n=1 Tax=Rubrivirga sp. IMCC45206 TaxID=3391614 RepID=UPI0039901302
MRVLCLALFALAAGAHAQPATIDTEFVEAVLGITESDGALLVGEAPDSVRVLLPEGADVLGTIASTDYRAPYVMTVARVDGDAAAVAATIRASTVDGWDVHPDPRRPEARGGFVTEPALVSEVLFVRGEGPEQFGFVGVLPRSAGGAFVVVRMQEGTPYGLDPDEAFDAHDRLKAHVPRLTSPPGDRQRATGGGGSGDYQILRAELDSDLPPAALASHYDAQLAEGGWTGLSGATRGDLAVSTWTRTIDGERFTATFEADRTADGTYALALVVLGPDD